MAYNFDTTSPFPSYDDMTSSYPYYDDATSSYPYYDDATSFGPYYDDATSFGPSYIDTTSPGPYYDDTTSPRPYYDDTTSPGPYTTSPAPTSPSPAPTSPSPAPTPSMDWTAGAPYKKGQIVFYNGVEYTCNLDILSSPPPNVNMTVWSSNTSPPSIPVSLSDPSQSPAYDVFSVKQIVTYVLAIALFFIVSRLFIFISDKYKTNINIVMLAGALVFGIILFGLMYVVNTNIDNFHFELTPIKKCQGGPYMYSSDPERQKLCAHFSPKEYCQYNCGRGFVGAPVHWNRSSESDSNWSNSEMTINDSYDYPQVL